MLSQLRKIAHRLKDTDKYEFVGTEAFKIIRDDEVFKLRRHESYDESIELHHILLENGLRIQKIYSVENDEKGHYKKVEWLEGKTFRELITEKKILPEHYEKLGRFVAQVNNIAKDGKNAGYINYLPKNLFLKDNGEVIVIDQGKLTWSVFPENAIIRYILTEDLVDNKAYTFELRAAFLKGYRALREFDFIKVLHQQYAFCTDGTGERYYKINCIKEAPIYHPVQKGRQVLEIITGTGARALQEMLAGAEYVYSCDIYHQRHGKEIFKASDLGKFLAYIHGFDGRDLHYKWIELNSDHFLEHLKNTTRKFDLAIVHFGLLKITPEREEKLIDFLINNVKELDHDRG